MSGADFTDLLQAYRADDEQQLGLLFPPIYAELKSVAHGQLNRSDVALDTTALVHEAYVRMADQSRVTINDRHHFLAIAARAMRQVLVAAARKRKAAKRGGGSASVTLEDHHARKDDQLDVVLAVEEAMERLAEVDERLQRVVECLFFAGYSPVETGEALGVSEWTVRRDWQRAKGLLERYI